jgi:putative oxidoreductase
LQADNQWLRWDFSPPIHSAHKDYDMDDQHPGSSSRPYVDRTAVDVSLLIVRVIVGFIFAYHGYPKVFQGGMHQMAEGLGPVAYLVAVGEFFGGLGLMAGVLARFSAAANIVIMIGAIAMVHGRHGFALQNQGYEYNLALIGLLAPVLIAGPGRFSIGRFLPLPKRAGTDRPVLPLE